MTGYKKIISLMKWVYTLAFFLILYLFLFEGLSIFGFNSEKFGEIVNDLFISKINK